MRFYGLVLPVCGLLALHAGAEDKKDTAAGEVKKLEGNWLVHSQTFEGMPHDDMKPSEFVFAGSALTIKTEGETDEKMTFTVDPSGKIKTMDFKPEKKPAEGVVVGVAIYELDGDTLKVCIGLPRPKELTDKDQPLLILKRKK
jgi:uncharacterized protein (TIGR03067 family)